MLRGSAIAIVMATLGAAGALGATAIRGRNTARDAAKPLEVVANTALVVPAKASAETRAAAGRALPQGEPIHALQSPPASLAPSAAPVPSAPSAVELRSILPQGESPLGEGIVAQRGDSEVVVSFDTPDLRTRTPEKFERFVRATLPQVYGPRADSALAKIPEGALTKQGNLLTELPIRGVRMPLNDGSAIVLYPETRPGRDGPLVIRYRTTITR